MWAHLVGNKVQKPLEARSRAPIKMLTMSRDLNKTTFVLVDLSG
jgi:hypothetical protein